MHTLHTALCFSDLCIQIFLQILCKMFNKHCSNCLEQNKLDADKTLSSFLSKPCFVCSRLYIYSLTKSFLSPLSYSKARPFLQYDELFKPDIYSSIKTILSYSEFITRRGQTIRYSTRRVSCAI